MRMMEVLSAAVLFLAVPANAQAREQEKQPEKQQAKPAQEAKPAQQQAKPAQTAKPAPQAKSPQEARPAQQAKPAQQQAKSPAKPDAKPARQQAKAAPSAGSHGRIPDTQFRASFGSGHTFHVSRADFSGASRRFQYGGYSWALINPWPVGWLYTDSVYVDYMNGGYFLCDPVHPGVYLSINIG